jgi:hypothetical protein
MLHHYRGSDAAHKNERGGDFTQGESMAESLWKNPD